MIEIRVSESTVNEEIEALERITRTGSVFDRLDALESGVNDLNNKVVTVALNMAAMTDRVDDLSGVIDDVYAATADTGWRTLSLTNGIQAYNEANTPQYRKIGKLVVIRGTVKGVTARNTVIGTLPDGFRPTKANPYVQNTSLATGNFATQTRVTVTTTGDVKLEAISDNAVFGVDKWFPIATMFLVD